MRIVADLDEVGADRWNTLLGASPDANPFLKFEFLHALHESGCASERTGWEPKYLTLSSGDILCAAVPLYRKHHSYGEYVFDWAWAEAHQRHDIAYYPKWLAAVPFTPVPGARLLAVDAQARAQAARVLIEHFDRSALSSLHVLYPPADEARLLAGLGMLTRHSVQFHWFNRGYDSFDAYLSHLAQPKRKKVRAERRKVADAGVRIRRVTGRSISEGDWSLFARVYRGTYAAHHSTPYLNSNFFTRIAQSMPDNLLMVIAAQGGRDIAAALALFDESRLYGRYWGTLVAVPCLHFEVSYYQLIEFAIERKLAVIEGGAQGEHKLARGFEPVTTSSSHLLRHPAFTDAVARYLARESGGIEAYVDELHERSAFRTGREPA